MSSKPTPPKKQAAKTKKSNNITSIAGDAPDLLKDLSRYLSQGLSIIPVHPKSKAAITGWETLELSTTDDLRKHFPNGKPMNVGLRLGGGGLVDIDLDCPEALKLAPYFLPMTGMRFGRKSSPNSHYMYISDLIESVDQANYALHDPISKGSICDLRIGGGGKAAQTVVPPSIHKTGEAITWSEGCDGIPTEVPSDRLLEAWKRLAFAALIMRHWPPEGQRARHHAASVLGGWLARNEFDPDSVSEMVTAIAIEVGDPEIQDRVNAAQSAAKKHHDGKRSYGHKQFSDVFGSEVAEAVKSHFKVHSTKGVSEIGLAMQFAEDYADAYRYVAGWGWTRWDGKRWQRDALNRVVSDLAEFLSSIGKASGKPAAYGSAKIIFAVEKLARSSETLAASSEMFDTDIWALNTPEGVIDLRTGNLVPAEAGNFHSHLTGCAPRKMETPVWDKFLSETFDGDEKLITYMQRLSGYCLTGNTKEQILSFWHGGGGNGKGIYLGVLSGILGTYYGNLTTETLMRKRYTSSTDGSELAALKGVRMVAADEVEEGRTWNETLIKGLTGGGPVTARHLYQNSFSYQPQFKLIVVGNHKPAISTVDAAWQRRFQMVPFINDVPKDKVDPELSLKLKAEWPGILQWMLQGCLDWQRHGLQPPEAILKANEAYFEEQDTFKEFVGMCLKPSKMFISGLHVYEAWSSFCKRSGEFAGTRKSFTQRMKRCGFIYKKDRQGCRGFDAELTEDGLDLIVSKIDTPPI